MVTLDKSYKARHWGNWSKHKGRCWSWLAVVRFCYFWLGYTLTSTEIIISTTKRTVIYDVFLLVILTEGTLGVTKIRNREDSLDADRFVHLCHI